MTYLFSHELDAGSQPWYLWSQRVPMMLWPEDHTKSLRPLRPLRPSGRSTVAWPQQSTSPAKSETGLFMFPLKKKGRHTSCWSPVCRSQRTLRTTNHYQHLSTMSTIPQRNHSTSAPAMCGAARQGGACAAAPWKKQKKQKNFAHWRIHVHVHYSAHLSSSNGTQTSFTLCPNISLDSSAENFLSAASVTEAKRFSPRRCNDLISAKLKTDRKCPCRHCANNFVWWPKWLC